jgi:hypothetical protein
LFSGKDIGEKVVKDLPTFLELNHRERGFASSASGAIESLLDELVEHWGARGYA